MYHDRQRGNFFRAEYLGRILLNPVQRVLLVDPYILSGPAEVKALDRFLTGLRAANNVEVRVKSRTLRSPPGGGDYATSTQQSAAVQQLRARFPGLHVQTRIINYATFPDHDRWIVVSVVRNNAPRYYCILLGHGLYGFEAVCKKRSEGVWFEIDANEFQTRWQVF